jgi:hypothetical protein
MAKSPKAPLSFTSYALNKCLIGYGVVNGIINAAIFAGLHAAAEGATFDMGAVVSDLSFTGILLGMLLFACVVPLTRMDLRKNVFKLPAGGAGAFPLVSGSYAVSILVVGALACVFMTGIGALLSLALPAGGATVTGMMILKGLVCACGAVAGYFTISFVVRGQQRADAVAEAMAAKTAEISA